MTQTLGAYNQTGSALDPVKRFWLTLILAVVLSAIEVERVPRYSRPDPIVHLTSYTPPVPPRLRRYRPHYRNAMSRR